MQPAISLAGGLHFFADGNAVSEEFLFRIVFDIAVAVVAAAAWLYAWRMRRDQVTRDQIEESRHEATSRLNNHGERLTNLEAAVRAAPRSEAVHDLALSVKELAGDIKALTSRLDATVESVNRIENVSARLEQYIHELNKTRGCP